MEPPQISPDVNIGNYPLQDILHPHPHDVLCGRGGGTNNHIGNSHWRMLVAANKQLYITLPKRQKMLLSRSIVHAVRSQNPPGRFLQKEPKTDRWYDIGDQRAQEKTSQALREGAPDLRSKMAKDKKPSDGATSEGPGTSSTGISTSTNGTEKSSTKTEELSRAESAQSQGTQQAQAEQGSVTSASPTPPPPPRIKSPATSGVIPSAQPPAGVVSPQHPSSSGQTTAPSAAPVPSGPNAGPSPGNTGGGSAPVPGNVPSSSPGTTTPQGPMPVVASQPPPVPQQMMGVPGMPMHGQMPMGSQMPGQMAGMPGQMPGHPIPMPGQMSGQMPNQMPGQMPNQMPNQMGMIPGQMPGTYYPAPNIQMQMVPAMIMNEQGMMVPVMSYVPQMPPPVPAQGPYGQRQQHQQGQQTLSQQSKSNNNQHQQQSPQSAGRVKVQHSKHVHDKNKLGAPVQELPTIHYDKSFDEHVDAIEAPDCLDMNTVSLGSLAMADEHMRASIGNFSLTEAEQKQLLTSLEPSGTSFGSTMSYVKTPHPYAFDKNDDSDRTGDDNHDNTKKNDGSTGQPGHDKAVAAGQSAGAAEAADSETMPVPDAVDGGLEPTGISFGSVFSMMSEDKRLEPTGISFGSMMSFKPEEVDGGLEAIGTSFGSMSLDQRSQMYGTAPPPPPPPQDKKEDDDAPLHPTLMGPAVSRSGANLLECPDTESESEGEIEKLKAQKSAAWDKLKNTFEAQKSGCGESLMNPPLPLNDADNIPHYMPNGEGYNNGYSQADHYNHMAALGNMEADQYVVPGSQGPGDWTQAPGGENSCNNDDNPANDSATSSIQRAQSSEEMPPPPPAMKKTGDEWDDLLYLDRQNSLLDDFEDQNGTN